MTGLCQFCCAVAYRRGGAAPSVGYNNVITKKYPKGQPNNMIARSCESGSSSMIKQPFMRTAVNASRSRAEQKMAEILTAEIKKKMEG
jgi:hypothetical protein